MHAHLHPLPLPIRHFGTDDLLRVMARHEIRLTLVSSSDAVAYDMAAGNAALSRDIESHEQLRGYVFANPNYVQESCEELRRYLELPHFVGVKLRSGACVSKPLSCREHYEILTLVSHEYPWALILVHCSENDAGDFAALGELAKRFPELTFIAGHMGAGRWREALPLLSAETNIVAEISAPIAARPRIEDAVGIMGPERVVFGSDFPLISQAYTIGAVQDAAIPQQHREMILFDNADIILRRAQLR